MKLLPFFPLKFETTISQILFRFRKDPKYLALPILRYLPIAGIFTDFEYIKYYKQNQKNGVRHEIENII